MESASVKALSKYRFEKALSNISVAKTLFESGNYGVALNRAYYSAFDAAFPHTRRPYPCKLFLS